MKTYLLLSYKQCKFRLETSWLNLYHRVIEKDSNNYKQSTGLCDAYKLLKD